MLLVCEGRCNDDLVRQWDELVENFNRHVEDERMIIQITSEGQKLIRRLAHVEHELVDWSTDAWACKKCDHVRRWGGNGGDVWEGRNGEK